ncbi:uncharacterized protein LOC115563041 isoform X2 [Drosophila navojoa]|nr:uncharacterized protein LOC115563041 isoform X2 [Drosophila navojoa]
MDQEIKFRIKDFNIGTTMPYIEGELLLEESETQNNVIKFEENEEVNTAPEANVELDALVELIKVETDIENEKPTKKKKASKRKQTVNPDVTVEKVKKIKKIKSEPIEV